MTDFLDSLSSNQEVPTSLNEVFDNEEAIQRIQERTNASKLIEEDGNLDSLLLEVEVDSKPLEKVSEKDFLPAEKEEEEAEEEVEALGSPYSQIAPSSSSEEEDETLDTFETYPNLSRQPSEQKRIPYNLRPRPNRINFEPHFKTKQIIAAEEEEDNLSDLMQCISIEERARLREMLDHISIIVGEAV